MLNESELDALLQRIQSHLASPEFIDESELIEDAKAYSELCKELNRKLAETAKLIDKGLRDDALRLLGPENQVIELFERCEFPEREDWCELTEIYGIPAPPTLNVDAAAKVNMTFAVLGDLQGLLKSHRILNLSRAPLSARMQILHSLAMKDIDNPIWDEDLAAFRKVRSQQLASEVDRAVSTENYEQVEALLQELNGPVWKGKAEPKLTAKLQACFAARQQRSLLQQLESVGESLQAAHSEFDVEAGMQLSDQVMDLVNRGKIAPDHPTVANLQQALDWVEYQRREIEQQQHDQQVIARLEQALETETRLEPIDLAYQRSLSLGSRLPEDLRRRAFERIEAFQLQAKRRLIAIVSSISVILVAMAVGLGIWIYTSQQETFARQVETTLAEMVSQEKLDEAEAFVNKQKASIQDRTAVQSLLVEINSLRQKEKSRAEEFASVLNELKNEKSAEPNDRLFNKLSALAKTDEEKKALREQEKVAENKRLAMKQAEQKQTLAKLEELETQFKTTLNENTETLAKIKQLNQVRSDVLQFMREKAVGQSTIRDTAQQLERRIDAAIERQQTSIKAKSEINNITKTIGNVTAYQEALSQFRQNYPMTNVANIAILDRVKEINEDTLWIKLLANPIITDPLRADCTQAAEWISDYDKAKELNSTHFFDSMVRDVSSAIRVQSKVGNAINSLKKISESQLLNKMYIYPYQNANYYSDDAPSQTGSNIDYFTDFTMSTNEIDFGERFRIVLPRVRESGHSEFGKKFRRSLTSMTCESFYNSCKEILHDLNSVPADNIDPFFHLQLYRILLREMVPVCKPVEAGFADFREALNKNEDIDWNTNWLSIETKNPELNRQRELARETLQLLENFSEREQKMEQSFKNTPKGRQTNLEWVGWVHPDEGSKKVLFVKSLPDTEMLVAIVRDSQGKSQVKKLGTPANILNLNEADIQPGAAVYSVKTSKGKE